MNQMSVAKPTAQQDKAAIDPVTISVLWNRFLSITEEMGSTLRSTAFSEAVREGDDFSTGIFDRKGRLIAQGNFTPGHTGSMPYLVKSMLEYFPAETLHPGDGLISNDSFLGSGHFPDIFMLTPVFREQEIIGYMINIAHHVDVGGYAPGSQEVAGVTSAIQEGIRILPVRLIRNGEFDPELLRIVLANVRLPDKLFGDLKAQRNANFVGARRFLEVFAEAGDELAEGVIEEIFDRSEKRMREHIGRLPKGSFAFEDWLDDTGPGSPPVRVHCVVTIQGDDLTIDFSGSSDQVAAGINSYINYTRAYSAFAVKVLADALLPQNHGAARPITVTSREGSFFNPKYPAPSGGRAGTQVRIFEAVNGALAAIMPERVMGAHSHWGNPNISGVDDRTGKQFVQYDLVFGGLGALSYKDGAEAMSPVMNCSNIPIEVLETNNPLLFHRLELVADSAGAGKFRGGCAMRKDVEIRNSKALITLLGDRHVNRPYGVFGGKPGTLAETILVRDGEETQLGSKQSLQLRRGDIISYRLSGAGGYEDPAKRDLSKIESDLLDGYVTEAGAEQSYGVRIRNGKPDRDK